MANLNLSSCNLSPFLLHLFTRDMKNKFFPYSLPFPLLRIVVLPALLRAKQLMCFPLCRVLRVADSPYCSLWMSVCHPPSPPDSFLEVIKAVKTRCTCGLIGGRIIHVPCGNSVTDASLYLCLFLMPESSEALQQLQIPHPFLPNICPASCFSIPQLRITFPRCSLDACPYSITSYFFQLDSPLCHVCLAHRLCSPAHLDPSPSLHSFQSP